MNAISRSMAALLGAALLFVAGPADATRLTLLHVNDSHSRLDAWGPKDWHLDGTLGGLTKAATVIKAVEQREENAFLVHAGDAFHGDLFFTYFFGVPEFQILAQLNLVAFAVGNHEFELGPDVLAGSLHAAAQGVPPGCDPATSCVLPPFEGPVLSANIKPDLITGQGVLAGLVAPHRMVEIGGVRVGFIGLTIPDPMSEKYVVSSSNDHPEPGEFFVSLAQSEANALREGGAEVVVLLSHLGVDLSRLIAANTTGIDVVVQGHDHVAWDEYERVGSAIVVSAGEYYGHVGVLRLDYDPSAGSDKPHVVAAGYDLVRIGPAVERDPMIAAIVKGLAAEIVSSTAASGGEPEDFFHHMIAWAVLPFAAEVEPGAANLSTPIGNLVTDIYRARAHGADIAFEASGFAEVPLPWGPIVGADVFRTMSYGHDEDPLTRLGARLVTFTLTGEQLLNVLDAAMALSVPQVSGMKYAIDSSLPVDAGRVVPSSVMVGGTPLDLTKRYVIATNDFIAEILTQYEILTEAPTDCGISIYEALRDGMAKMRWLVPNHEMRIEDLAGVTPGRERSRNHWRHVSRRDG